MFMCTQNQFVIWFLLHRYLLQIFHHENKIVSFVPWLKLLHWSIFLWCIRGIRTWAQRNAWQAASSQDIRIIRTLSDRVSKPVFLLRTNDVRWQEESAGQTSYRYYNKYSIFTMASTTNQGWMSRYNLNFIRGLPTPRGCSSNIRFLMVSYSMCSVETEETDRMLARGQCSSVVRVTECRGQHPKMRCLPRVKHFQVYRRRRKR